MKFLSRKKQPDFSRSLGPQPSEMHLDQEPSNSNRRITNNQSVPVDLNATNNVSTPVDLNTPIQPKRRPLVQALKYGAYGITSAIVGGVLVTNGAAILSGLGTAASAVGGAFGTAGGAFGVAAGAGAVTVPLGGVGLGVLAATAVAGVGYASYKTYKHKVAKKSIFSNRDVKSFNPAVPRKNGKLMARTIQSTEFGNSNGYGLFINQGKGRKALENSINNNNIIHILDYNDKMYPGLSTNFGTQDGRSPLRDYVCQMSLTDKLAYLANHEFSKQLENTRSSRNGLIKSLGEDPFKKISPEGLASISEVFDERAVYLNSKGCRNKAEICASLSDAAKSLSMALTQIQENPQGLQDFANISRPITNNDEEIALDNFRDFDSNNNDREIDAASYKTSDDNKELNEFEAQLKDRLSKLESREKTPVPSVDVPSERIDNSLLAKYEIMKGLSLQEKNEPIIKLIQKDIREGTDFCSELNPNQKNIVRKVIKEIYHNNSSPDSLTHLKAPLKAIYKSLTPKETQKEVSKQPLTASEIFARVLADKGQQKSQGMTR